MYEILLPRPFPDGRISFSNRCPGTICRIAGTDLLPGETCEFQVVGAEGHLFWQLVTTLSAERESMHPYLVDALGQRVDEAPAAQLP